MPIKATDPAPWIAVREVMSPVLASVPADAPLGVAVAEVLRTRTDRVWVTSPGGGLAGVLSDVALLRAETRGDLSGATCGELAVRCTPLHAAADAAAALPRLNAAGEPRVPVLDGGRLAGELTRADALGLVHSVRRVAAVRSTAPATAPEPRTEPAAPRFLSRARRRAAEPA